MAPGAPGCRPLARFRKGILQSPGTQRTITQRSMPSPPPAERDFAERLRPHAVGLLRYLRRILHRPDDAADALQSALLSALQVHGQFDPEGSFRVWIFRFATLEAQNHNRREWRERQRRCALPEDPPRLPDIAAELAYQQVLEQPERVLAQLEAPLALALGDLREQERAAFLLRALADLSCTEIGAILESPKGTVMSWLFRAREQLRRRLSEFALERGWEAGKR